MEPRAEHMHSLAMMALDALPQSVLIVEQSGRIIMRNALRNQVLRQGLTIAETLRNTGQAVLDWPAAMTMLPKTPMGLTFANTVVQGSDGQTLTVDIYLTAIPSPMGEHQAEKGTVPISSSPFSVLVVVTDVSARASLERRLLASERLAAVGELAAKVAHELNNPLDGVLRYIGLAQRSQGLAAGYLDNARAGLMRMAAVVRDLLEQGHPRQGRFSAPLEKLLKEALSAMHPRSQAQGVTVEMDLCGPPALADGNLFQVFCNLVKNALDAMPRGGNLAIRQRAADGQCVIEFADTGCGIAPADIERVFEPFFTTKPVGEGSGLGLAVCRQIVMRLGGTIAASPQEQGGTVFTIRLPIAGETPAPRQRRHYDPTENPAGR